MPIPVKDAFVGMRVTPVKRALYRQVAEQEGLRLSAWLRTLADRQVADRLRDSAEPAER
jgi:hypothetical protein